MHIVLGCSTSLFHQRARMKTLYMDKHTKSPGSCSLRGFLRSKLITVLDGLFKNGNFIDRFLWVGNMSRSFSALLSYASTSDKFLSTTSSNNSSSSSSLELSGKQQKLNVKTGLAEIYIPQRFVHTI